MYKIFCVCYYFNDPRVTRTNIMVICHLCYSVVPLYFLTTRRAMPQHIHFHGRQEATVHMSYYQFCLLIRNNKWCVIPVTNTLTPKTGKYWLIPFNVYNDDFLGIINYNFHVHYSSFLSLAFLPRRRKNLKQEHVTWLLLLTHCHTYMMLWCDKQVSISEFTIILWRWKWKETFTLIKEHTVYNQ